MSGILGTYMGTFEDEAGSEAVKVRLDLGTRTDGNGKTERFHGTLWIDDIEDVKAFTDAVEKIQEMKETVKVRITNAVEKLAVKADGTPVRSKKPNALNVNIRPRGRSKIKLTFVRGRKKGIEVKLPAWLQD